MCGCLVLDPGSPKTGPPKTHTERAWLRLHPRFMLQMGSFLVERCSAAWSLYIMPSPFSCRSYFHIPNTSKSRVLSIAEMSLSPLTFPSLSLSLLLLLLDSQCRPKAQLTIFSSGPV